MLVITWKSMLCSLALVAMLLFENGEVVVAFDGPFENCEIFEKPGPQGICTGHGSCINNTCECEDGFTGLSDFINTEGLDCQINELAIKSIWGGLLAVLVIVQLKSVPKMYARYEDFREVQREGKMNGERIRITRNKGVLAIVVYEGLMIPTLVAMIVTKLVSNNERIGVTFIVTFLFFLCKSLFYGSAMLFQPALVSTLLKVASFGHGNTVAVEKLIRFNNVSSFINWLCSSLLGLLPFITYANGGKWDERAEYVWLSYLGGSVVTLTLYALQCLYLKKKVKEVLSEGSSIAGTGREKMEKVKKVLISLQDSTVFQVVLNCAIYIAFLVVPLMWNRHDYYLPLSWLAFVLLGKKLADTHVSDGHSKKDLKKVGSYNKLTKASSFTTIQDSRVDI